MTTISFSEYMRLKHGEAVSYGMRKKAQNQEPDRNQCDLRGWEQEPRD